jgi:hypothetical protein
MSRVSGPVSAENVNMSRCWLCGWCIAWVVQRVHDCGPRPSYGLIILRRGCVSDFASDLVPHRIRVLSKRALSHAPSPTISPPTYIFWTLENLSYGTTERGNIFQLGPLIKSIVVSRHIYHLFKHFKASALSLRRQGIENETSRQLVKCEMV